MTAPLVSVVIPVRDEERNLRACLDSLLAQRHVELEIIVIDDGSTDATAEILREYGSRVRTLQTGGVGPSRGRNLGVALSAGEYVAFTDGDCVCDPLWLSELLRPLREQPDAGGVGGAQLTPADDPPYARRVGAFLQAAGFVGEYTKAAAGRVAAARHNPTCNVLYRRAVFDAVDGFLEWLWPGEDVEFDRRVRRAGFRLLYNPAALVYHHRPDTPQRFRRMMFRYGWAQGILVRLHGPFRAIQALPAVLAAALAAAVAVGWISPAALVLTAALAAVALLGALRRRTPDTPTALACAAMLPGVLWAWNRGYLAGLLAGDAGARTR